MTVGVLTGVEVPQADKNKTKTITETIETFFICTSLIKRKINVMVTGKPIPVMACIEKWKGERK
jgi:hypothetical protein